MQELTRELSAAYNVCEHHNDNKNHKNNQLEMSPNTAISKNTNLEQQSGLAAAFLLPASCIKRENPHTPELLPVWQSSASPDPTHLRLDFNANSKLLLQGSDDPLISHGDAHDEDHPFKTLLARKSQEQRVANNGACSSLTKQQLKVKASLMSARKTGHRQATHAVRPAQPSEMAAPAEKLPPKTKKRQSSAGALKLRFHHQALPAEYLSHYEAAQARQLPAKAPQPNAKPAPAKQSHENVRSWLRKIAEIQRSAERQQQAQDSTLTPGNAAPTPQIELQTASPAAAPLVSKRNPLKYADLPYMGEITLDNYKPRRGRKPKKADICHLIYKNYGTIVPPTITVGTSVASTSNSSGLSAQKLPVLAVEEEPLNLCLRDQSSDRYSISSGSDSEKPSTTDCGSCITPLTLQLTATTPDTPLDPEPPSSAKLLLQPVGVYYQQLMESCAFGLPVPVETIEKDNQLALKIPIPSGFFANVKPLVETPPPKRKRSAIFIPPMPAEHSSSPSNEVSICKFKFTGGAKPTLLEKKMLSVDAEGNYRYYNGTGDKTMRGYEFISRDQQQQQQQQQQQLLQQQQQEQPNAGSQDKLYIDIPPPSTDLSLELLHIPPESPTTSLLISNNLISPQSPASSSQSPMPAQTQSEPLPLVSSSSSSGNNNNNKNHNSHNNHSSSCGKRRCSRRSKQREKLEKTFKEKGFLIQTQQLQSAEGATYCKFRQLKKFTRYLFRNWKDHIPPSDLAKHQSSAAGGAIENLLAGQKSAESVSSAAATDPAT